MYITVYVQVHMTCYILVRGWPLYGILEYLAVASDWPPGPAIRLPSMLTHRDQRQRSSITQTARILNVRM